MGRLLAHTWHGPESATPIVIIHGLFGHQRNWNSVVADLSKQYWVLTVDCRNHGQSFHDPEHTIDVLAEDLILLLKHLNVKSSILVGHSMGGLCTMAACLVEPSLFTGLVAVDIAPRAYYVNYESEFKALSMPLQQFKSRKEIDAEMEKIIGDKNLRAFLQTNIVGSPGEYRWQLNVAGLENSTERAVFPKKLDGMTSTLPALLLAGGRSNFIVENDGQNFLNVFLQGDVKVIPHGDHWLHYSAQKDFLDILNAYCSDLLC